jgi:hypothetical protein
MPFRQCAWDGGARVVGVLVCAVIGDGAKVAILDNRACI